MKVLILSISDKRHMPMIAPYLEYMERRGIEYDIIRANRYEHRIVDQINERSNGMTYEINMLFDASISRARKIIPFLKFMIKARHFIAKKKYAYIIVWNENTAAIFAWFLSRHYPNRYCINIRDAYSHQKGFRQLVSLALKNSSFITVPSPEMTINSYEEKKICLYNKDSKLMEITRKKDGLRQDGRPIRITHLGYYHKVKRGAQEILKQLGNDPRFELHFFGQGFDTEFKEIVDENNITNVVLGGAFPYEDTAKYLEETDIINSYYNRFEHPSLKISFGIKHSYTPMLYLPGIADEDTCWGRLSSKYNLAFLVNNKNISSLGDELYNWYMNIDFNDFVRKCDDFNKMIDDSIDTLYRKLDSALSIQE